MKALEKYMKRTLPITIIFCVFAAFGCSRIGKPWWSSVFIGAGILSAIWSFSVWVCFRISLWTMLIVVALTGCEAIQPFAKIDKNGYQAGVQGTWPAVKRQVVALVGSPESKGLVK